MKRGRINLLLTIFLILLLTMAACDIATDTIPSKDYHSELIVHFIDVGQGDSTLVQLPNGEVALIDGGARNAKDKVVEYIKGLGIEEIDYIIATHPHEDHIGGLPHVIRNFIIHKIYMPNRTANTLVFEELLLEIEKKNLKIDIVKAKDYIIDEEGLKVYFLAPNRDDYSQTNDFSIVTKIDYLKNSLIIAGDAEESSEIDMVNSNLDLRADLLRVGHHGGRSSSTEGFLNKVNPKYSIISVGRDNNYGHPHEETLERLSKVGTEILRTDQVGDIVFVSDGQKWRYESKITAGSIEEATYIGNKNTKVFHSRGCNSLPDKENQIYFKTILEAEKNGYRPHKNCVK